MRQPETAVEQQRPDVSVFAEVVMVQNGNHALDVIADDRRRDRSPPTATPRTSPGINANSRLSMSCTMRISRPSNGRCP